MKAVTFITLLLIMLVCLSSQKPYQDKKIKKTIKIAVISDLNSSYGATAYHPDVYATLKELENIKPDIILCAGDMIAGQKASLTTAQTQAMWNSFDNNILKPIQRTKVPFGFTVGNHDASPSYLQDRELAQQFWKSKQKQLGLNFIDQSHFPFYYSYQQNGIFFISWDAAGSKVNQEVFNWMEKQLQSKAAKKAKLRILLGHLPLYAIVASKNKPGEVLANNEKTANFFEQNGIDLYISGHQHAYYPSFAKKLRLLNTGCVGEGPRPLLGDHRPATRAYTMIEVPVNEAKKFSYQTFIPNTNGSTIEFSKLPDSVVGFNGISKKDVALGRQ
ncbi:metallophosphoesterase family protein [Pedobacter sp. SL55]|uniref:metallophosphoesterase family protein n=1 Tax=Pedobacter sp. SL55 TaxID=2995161 RepID=UPI0022715BF4|nr:metallophosphoesterase [Pedobacter sp. SL55]WAC39258.1 metallophosphoesterase [Pedobacter sp. SL55]